MNSQRPISRKKIQILVILTILVWATQTLLHQWGFGAEVPAVPAEPAPEAIAAEKFVPEPSRLRPGATLEVRAEATIHGSEVRIKQVCRWSDADARSMAQVGDLVVARFGPRVAFKTISVDEIRQTLHDAGANLAFIRFAGPVACTVSRSDVEFNEGQALDQWIAARQGGGNGAADAAVQPPATQPSGETVHDAAGRPTTRPVAPSETADAAQTNGAPETNSPVHSLQELLTADLAVRLGLPKEELQVSFNPADQKALNLLEPQFKFNLDGRNIRNLGPVSWEVQIVTDSESRKMRVTATARAWQRQAVLTRPLSCKQILQTSDVQERRMLSDHLPDEPLLSSIQAVGQQASRDLKPGVVLTSRMVDAVPLVRTGQFVTVTLSRGNVQIKTVARAVEGGSFGQTIKVKNEATRDVFEVVITGPQEATVGAEPAAKVASLRE